MTRYVFCILLLTSGACTKFGKAVTAEGRVINPITGEGIPDVEMQLLKSTSGIPGGNKAVKTTFTDANGYYEISKGGLKTYSLACNISSDYYAVGWFVNGEIINTNTGNYELKKGKVLHADYYAVPYGNIILDIHNVNCQSAEDSMQFTSKYIYADSDNGWSTYRLGCYSYLSPNPSKVPAGSYVYTTKVTRNGVTTFVYDTVFVSQNSTTTIQIAY